MIEIPADLARAHRDHGGAEVMLVWLLEHGHITHDDLQRAGRTGAPIILRQVPAPTAATTSDDWSISLRNTSAAVTP